jgi:hypothetical protein
MAAVLVTRLCHRTAGPSGQRGRDPRDDRGSVMPPVRVISAGPQATAEGAAELWCGDDLLAVTFLYDGRLHLRIEPRADGQQWLIDATSLALALDEAAKRIEY